MRRHALGLTLIELITVVAIIAILVGILIPATQAARRAAQNAKQRVQLTAMDTALVGFQSDYGDYPPSVTSGTPWRTGSPGTGFYCGAQKLAEALVGRDMGGFDPNSRWSPDDGAYGPSAARKGLYLDPGTANAFRLGQISAENKPGLYANVQVLAPDTFVLCDVYVQTKVLIAEGTGTREVRLGAPILYYKAEPSRRTTVDIYSFLQNSELISAKNANDGRGAPWLLPTAQDDFYRFISDPRVVAANPRLGRPYRPDSYILVSAGPDGIYGTGDDVCNFSRVGSP